jgi:predicted small metal-binding protein
MSKVRGAIYTCPECGFSVRSPFGPEDVAEHVKLHAEKHHNDKVTKARITKTQLIKLQ